jgi:hypothetical protein
LIRTFRPGCPVFCQHLALLIHRHDDGDGEGGRTASALLQFLCNVFKIFFFVEIGCDVVCLAFAERVEFSTRLFAGRGVARGNVDVCAVLNEPFADHAADAFGAAGHEDDFVLESG